MYQDWEHHMPKSNRRGNITSVSDFCSLLFCLPAFKMSLVSGRDMVISAIHTTTDLNREAEVSNSSLHWD